MKRYWSKKEEENLVLADDFRLLVNVAFAVLNRMPQPVGMVCGPISTGGKGSIRANLKEIRLAAKELKVKGAEVFAQAPFEKAMAKLCRCIKKGYCMDILYKFYLPLFKSGLITTLYFLPSWQSSFGASWEHKTAKRLGIKIVYLA